MERDKLRIYYQNIRGVNTKTHIRSNFSAANYHMIALTETWIQDNFSSSEIFDESFVVHRSDRNLLMTNKKSGGGCLVAIKNNISANRIFEWENELPFENVWLMLNLKQTNKKIYINVPYIPPNSKHDVYEAYYEHYTRIMCNVKPNNDFIICGDLNINQISWCNAGPYCIPIAHEGKIASDLLN